MHFQWSWMRLQEWLTTNMMSKMISKTISTHIEQMIPQMVPNMISHMVSKNNSQITSNKLWNQNSKIIWHASPALTLPTLCCVHCVCQIGGRMQGRESECFIATQPRSYVAAKECTKGGRPEAAPSSWSRSHPLWPCGSPALWRDSHENRRVPKAKQNRKQEFERLRGTCFFF